MTKCLYYCFPFHDFSDELFDAVFKQRIQEADEFYSKVCIVILGTALGLQPCHPNPKFQYN